MSPRAVLYDADAESGLLGGILLDPNCRSALSELRPEAFGEPRNARLFEQLCTLPTETIRTPTLLTDALRDVGVLDAVGGKARLAQLIASTPSPAHAVEHAGIILKMALRRAGVEGGAKLIELAHAGDVVGMGDAIRTLGMRLANDAGLPR